MKPEQPQGPLVPYVFDNRRPLKRGKRVNNVPVFQPGQRVKTGVASHGGGGPENTGARNPIQAGIPLTQNQPSWRWEFEDDFFGHALPSQKPLVVASHAQPANSFRLLGDAYKGRQ